MTYTEENYLQISGLQHFLFCRRQWAIIHIEHQWVENVRTVDGEIMHENAHSEGQTEKRGNTIIARGTRVFSSSLGVSGQCDIIEFHRVEKGISLNGRDGFWSVYPIEYKRGSPKENKCDEAQLCAQAMCLEEMLCCEISEGSLFYGETKRRSQVVFTDELRSLVKDSFAEMHEYQLRSYTPKSKRTRACNACSLKEVCLPGLMKIKSIRDYMEANL